jgi:high affinity sulfate transporter 1
VRILPGLTRQNWPRESLSGVTLVAIAVPLNIGYAQIAGLPASAGLYSLILPVVVFALLSSTRQLVVAPDAAAAALVASSLGGLAVAGGAAYVQLAFAQAIIGGIVFALCGVFRLGFLANFLSEPILIGFVGGLALDILISQVAKMLGIDVDSAADVIPRTIELIEGLGDINWISVAISVASILILVLGRRVWSAIPWALVVLVLTTATVAFFGLSDRGVSVLGPVEGGPPTLHWPELDFSQWVTLIPSAIALTLVAIAEGLLVARRYAEKNGYETDPNRDLVAFAGANVASGLTGGFTVGSSASRTAAMDASGSRTQLPAIVAALVTLLLVIFGTALLADIPSPAIGAIVAAAVVPLLGFAEFRKLWHDSRFEFVIGAVCFLTALLIGPLVGVFVSFILAIVNVVRRASSPPVDVLGSDDTPHAALRGGQPDRVLTAPGVVVLRFAGPVFFANANRFATGVRDAVLAAKPQGARHLVLDFEAVNDIDVTAAGRMAETFAWVREQGVEVSFSRVRTAQRALLEHYGLLGEAKIFDGNRAAVEALRTGPSDPDGP